MTTPGYQASSSEANIGAQHAFEDREAGELTDSSLCRFCHTPCDHRFRVKTCAKLATLQIEMEKDKCDCRLNTARYQIKTLSVGHIWFGYQRGR